MSDGLKFNPPELINTERLILRKAQISDAALLHDAYMSDPDVAKFCSWKAHTELSQSEQWINCCIQRWNAGESYPFVIEYESKPIGLIGMHFMPDYVSFAFVIAKSCWGKGIMPEALNALIDLALVQGNIKRVQIFYHADNYRSQRAIEKCGLEFEHTFIQPDNKGEPVDCNMYSKVW